MVVSLAENEQLTPPNIYKMPDRVVSGFHSFVQPLTRTHEDRLGPEPTRSTGAYFWVYAFAPQLAERVLGPERQRELLEQINAWLFAQYDEKLTPAQKEYVVRHAFWFALSLRRELLGTAVLADAAPEQKYTQHDFEQFWEALQLVSPESVEWGYTPHIDDNGIRHTQQAKSHAENVMYHYGIAFEYADLLVPIINNYLDSVGRGDEKIDLIEFKIAICAHDLGRWITMESMVHERIEEILWEVLGIKGKILDTTFEAVARYTADDERLRDPQHIPVKKLLFVLIDIIAKFSIESQKDKLREVDVLSIVRMSAERAAHYVLPEMPMNEVRAQLQSMNAVQDISSWLHTQLQQVLQAEGGHPRVNQMVAQRHLNEVDFFVKLLQFFDGVLASQNTSLAGVRAQANEIVMEKMRQGIFIPKPNRVIDTPPIQHRQYQ